MADETMRLGLLRLTDAAPVVLAGERGLFAAEGVEVRLHVEPSWANVADKLAWGLLDGAVMLPPLALAMALGARAPMTPLAIPAGLSLNGNSVVLSNRLARAVLEGGLPQPEEAARRLQAQLPCRLRLAVVHAWSTHDLLLRDWLSSGGIDPARDAEVLVVPPADMVQALADGLVDGFCAGAPWSGVAAQAGVGRLVARSSAIWPDHPEKCLALRASWAARNHRAVQGVLRALLRAGRMCDDPVNAPSLARLLAAPVWVDLSPALIAASLPGGSGQDVDRSTFAAHGAMVPSRAHGRWFVRQMSRWRRLPAEAAAAADRIYQPDWHEEAARAVAEPLEQGAFACAHDPALGS